MKPYIFIGIMLLSYNFLSAQDLKKDFVAVYNNYNKQASLSMDVEVKSYTKGTNNTTIMSGKMRKLGKQYYSKFGTDEFIGNEEYALVVNHDLKTITYKKSNVFQKERSVDTYVEQLNTWLLNAETTKLLKTEGTKKTYEIIPKETTDLIKSIEIVLDMKQKVIDKIIYHYNDNQFVAISKVIINYKNISFKRPESSYFKGTKYLNIGKKVTLKPKYKNYKLYLQ
jgi:hypothetical protein